MDELDFCDETDVIFSMMSRNNQGSSSCNYFVFEGHCYTCLSGFVGRDIK